MSRDAGSVVERAKDYLAMNAAESGADVLIQDLVMHAEFLQALLEDAGIEWDALNEATMMATRRLLHKAKRDTQ